MRAKELFPLPVYTLALLTLPLLATDPCFGATKSVTKEAQQVQSAQMKASTAAAGQKFSMSMLEGDRVPQGFSGVPAHEIVASIEKISNLKKGEFETTAEFSARKAAAASDKLFGGLSADDLLAFVMPVPSGTKYISGLAYNFNADTGDLRLFVLPRATTPNGIGGPDYSAMRRPAALDVLRFPLNVDSKRTYQGSNAYGATVTVEETVATTLGIAADRISFLNFKREATYLNPAPATQLKMDTSKAAKALPGLKALVVVKLVEPYIVYDWFHSKPTRDDPTEITIQSKFLHSDILGIVFFSNATGEILARIPENFGVTEVK